LIQPNHKEDSLQSNRLYEVTLLCSPHLSQAHLGQLLGSLSKQVMDQEGSVLEESGEYWGLRNLAYELKKDRKRYRKAHYVLLYMNLPCASLPTVERFIKFRCNEEILRFLILKIDEVPQERSDLCEASLSVLRKTKPVEEEHGESLEVGPATDQAKESASEQAETSTESQDDSANNKGDLS
jgi:small subunit ribosomal protein S6